jgi:hypothetical protein
MPAKMMMYLSNGNYSRMNLKTQISPTSLGANSLITLPKAPSALNAPLISRIHDIKPGCGACGRH